MTARGLDHLIHLVRDLDAAAAAYERLGFRVSSENRHPFGTKNRIVQFPGAFIEILAIGDHAPVPDAAPGQPSFAAFHRDLLARAGEGGSGIALECPDARGDAAAFARFGIGDFQPFFFERRGTRAEGSDVHVAFELAFAQDAASPDALFFACDHKFPDFWSEEAQRHPNGATTILGAILTAENPSDHHVFLKAFTGVHDFRATSLGLSIATPRGTLDVLTPFAFRQLTGVEAPQGDGMRLAAIRIAAPRAQIAPGTDHFGLTLVLEEARAA
ncbi:VOC family protein [Chenggangzhangella methanolivorans]|uniref:VOC family protein n=1 Tax=Chenggangzhangella methanolivorans TaxID=1437009 RepID=A0A9E6R9J3_9HYPH|nr:VOC family protein [Chenggangzhangella methanolivorans]QZO00042.1 VOC family protein [Chenggangzhangella methanolivorans]